MFGRKKKAEENIDRVFEVYSVTSGEIYDLSAVPDDVFANRILGDGYAIKPDFNKIFSPVNGEIIDVQDSLHAYGIKSESGVEILVHIGINSVSLNGKGFLSHVKAGDKVRHGDLLSTVDLQVLSDNNIPTDTVVIITDTDRITDLKVNYGFFDTDSAPVMTYKLKRK